MNRDESLQNCYRYLVGDYGLKQYVKAVLKRPAVFDFLEHTQVFFLDCSQLCKLGRV